MKQYDRYCVMNELNVYSSLFGFKMLYVLFIILRLLSRGFPGIHALEQGALSRFYHRDV